MTDQPMEIKNVVPLLDVLFALLTFFVLSSLFLNRTEGLPVDLPKAQSGAMQKHLLAPRSASMIRPKCF